MNSDTCIVGSLDAHRLPPTFIYKLATCYEVKVILTEKSSFGSLLTIASWRLVVLGKSVIKSMVTCSQFHIGIGSNRSKPPVFSTQFLLLAGQAPRDKI